MEGTHFKDPAPGGSIKRQVVNPDLAEERAKRTFDPNDMNKIIISPEADKQYNEVVEDMRKHPELAPSHKYFELNREEQMEHDWNLIKKQGEINPKRYLLEQHSGFLAHNLHAGISPLTLHYGMFLVCLQKLGSREQNLLWEKDIKTLKKIGCYAQTELGHGSNVAGLETTATLDLNTDEFIIHSPTVTSTKFWPGSLGLWANHAVVFAQCHVSSK